MSWIDRFEVNKAINLHYYVLSDVTPSEELLARYRIGLTRTIDALPSKNQWIPCSEELPKLNQFVLASVKEDFSDSHNPIISRFDDSEIWHNGIITAWQQLPETYRDDEESDEYE